MAYVSLYRKYRSQTFEDVMGQQHVTKTLQNAIRLGKIAHAYLFCGTRGTGKTTTARLLAKALNCEKGPTPNPCNECPACVSITEGSAIDIVELDAASHRSIEDIKDINENVKFPPMELRYKVFIIDEAHQLSSDAKDAFLKTLEEPPAHAIFILATTEPQSIPVTIRSRCQQFDFRRGSLRDIKARLKFVAESEGVQVDDSALDLIAVSADGSWRDALSLLEQVLAYTDGHVTVDDVSTVLGMVTQDFLFRLADVIAQKDERGAFEIAAEVSESGRDIQQFLRSTAQHFRNLLFATLTTDLGGITTNEELALKLREQALKFDKNALLRIVDIFAEAEKETRESDQHRLILELSLLKAIETIKAKTALPGETQPQTTPKQPVSTPTSALSTSAQTNPAEKLGEPEDPVSDTASVKGDPKQRIPEFDKIKEKWHLVLQCVKAESRPAHSLLECATPAGIRNGALVLHFRYPGQAKLLIEESKTTPNTKRQALQHALARVFGVQNMDIICEVTPSPDEAFVPRPEEVEDLPDPFQDDGGQDTLQNVIEVFNGTLLDE